MARYGRLLLLVLSCAAFVLLVVAVSPGEPVRAAIAAVGIVDFAFQPDTITVNVGDTVTWTNNGPSAHTTTSSTGVWNSGPLFPSQSFSVTFNTAGSFPYLCTIHPTMQGTVNVVAAPAPTATLTITPSVTPSVTATATQSLAPAGTPTPTPTLIPGTPPGPVRLGATLLGASEIPGPGDPDAPAQRSSTSTPPEASSASTDVAVSRHQSPRTFIAAPVGVAGPIVVNFPPPVGGSSSGCLEGIDRVLLREIALNPGAFYVNVHTTELPAGAVRGQLAPSNVATRLPTSSDDDDEKDDLTPQQHQHTNRGNTHDVHTEGNVVSVEKAADGRSLLVTIALTRNETLVVQVPCSGDGANVTCPDIQAGDYLEADGYQNGVGDPNAYFVAADGVTVWRNGHTMP